MRFDSIGMFWEDRPKKAGSNEVTRPQPPIPETGWRAPTSFPNLAGAKVIALDTETYDPELNTAGPGWARGKGHIVGVSLGVQDGTAWYFPLRHTVCPEENMDPNEVLPWLKHVLETNSSPKVGANLIYDIGWLAEENIRPTGKLYDVQYAEALLNSESPDVSLESLATAYLNEGKDSPLLYQWCADFYGGAIGPGQRKNIYRAPPSLVGPYAESDAALPLRVLSKQWPKLEARGVSHLFDVECRLINLLVDMRRRGAPVDVGKAERLRDRLVGEISEIDKRMHEVAGFEVRDTRASLQKAFDHMSIPYGTTDKGNASFKASAIENVDHPLVKLLLERRRKEKIRGTFIESYIIDKHVNGRIHCSFHPLKGDENGARSGRLASSDPNLQNIPVRSDEGRLIRDIFVAHMSWRKYDYSQIEYRMLAHHAVGPGSDDIRARYRNNPDTDYHDATIELIRTLVAIELDRRPAKTINFGLIYGMSKRELIARLKLATKAGNDLFAAYHKAVPFASATAKAATEEAQNNGFVETILGRKSDFNLWVPAGFEGYSAKPLPFDQALMTYGSLERAATHKALNRKLQGGAADVMKTAMVELYDQGYFNETGIPMLTVHDELDFDDELEAPQSTWDAMAHLMETCMPQVTVPIRVDCKVGPTWGQAD